MTMTATKKTLTGTPVAVMMSWMKLHAQLVLRQMTQNFLNSLMAIWKTLMRLHLKCMHRQVAVFKKHVSFWLVSSVPEAIFLLFVLVLVTAWLSHPLIENLQSLVAKARSVRGKEHPLLRKVEKRQAWVHLAFCQKPQTSLFESRPPMSKKRPIEAGATRGGPHHAPRLRPDQCMLCRQVGHRASECPNKGKATAFSLGKGAFGTYALGCAVFDAPCYGATVGETEEDQDEEDIEDFVAFSIKSRGEEEEGDSPFLTEEPRRPFLDT